MSGRKGAQLGTGLSLPALKAQSEKSKSTWCASLKQQEGSFRNCWWSAEKRRLIGKMECESLVAIGI